MTKLMATTVAKRTTDDWTKDQKLAVAFGFIWFFVSLAQLISILTRLKFIPSAASRGPYIILSVTTLSLALYEALYAGELLSLSSGADTASLTSAAQFFWLVNNSFRPAVVLYLVHQRGDVLRAVKGNTMFPLSTRIWKRIMDWVLVAITLIMYIGSMGTWIEYSVVSYRDYYYYQEADNFYAIYLGLALTGHAFLILLCIEVVVSLIFENIQGKGTPDPILTYLIKAVLPLFCVYPFEFGFFHIFSLVASDYDEWALIVAKVFIDGAIRITIATALIITMSLPGVQWTPSQVLAPVGTTIPLQESPASSPIMEGFTPQQQPASYWPQPHVLPHEMPLGMSHEGNPYALRAVPGVENPTFQQPVAEIYSTTPPATTQALPYQQPVAETQSTTPNETTQDTTFQQFISELHSSIPPAPAQAMPYQSLYPSATRAFTYHSAPPASTHPLSYPHPSLASTKPPPNQTPAPVQTAPERYQSVPSPTCELFTHAVLPEEKKEKE